MHHSTAPGNANTHQYTWSERVPFAMREAQQSMDVRVLRARNDGVAIDAEGPTTLLTHGPGGRLYVIELDKCSG